MVIHRGREAGRRRETGGRRPRSRPPCSTAGLIFRASACQSRQKPVGTSLATSSRQPSMPSAGSPSPLGSIQRLVLSRTYCFGPGCRLSPAVVVGKLGQRLDAPPALVAKLVVRRGRIVERLHDVPIAVRRLGLPLAQIGEREEIAARVIEHAVDDHANLPRVRLPHQLQKQLVGRGPVPACRVARLLGHQRRDRPSDSGRSTDRCDGTSCRRTCAASGRRTPG